MSTGTTIEWTHRPGTTPATMNAIVGCQPVSEGCRNCYAMSEAHMRAGNPNSKFKEKFGGTTRRNTGKTIWTGKVTLTESALPAPLKQKKPTTYFVNSMSDLFYEGVPYAWVNKHFAVFSLCPHHTFIVLTKRADRQRSYVGGHGQCITVYNTAAEMIRGDSSQMPKQMAHHRSSGEGWWPLPNVWLGVSVEDQDSADKRIPLLLQTPAAVRFLSMEPLLGPVSIEPYIINDYRDGTPEELTRIDWVIVGGESGPGARPMHPDWARSVRDQCAAAGVPFFFKQWGEYAPDLRPLVVADSRAAGEGYELEDVRDCVIARVGKKAAGHLLDGVEHHAFPEVR